MPHHVCTGPSSLRFLAILLTATYGCSAGGGPEGVDRSRGEPDGGATAADAGVWTGDAGSRPPPRDGSDATADMCRQVDLLFVIDNSPSMRPYQEGLARAFPGFVDAMYDSLPSGVSLHVGVTTTAFFDGSCSESTINCRSGQTAEEIEAHYIPPTESSTGTNGEQGRLFQWDGLPYFEANTSDPDRAPLTEWFSSAATAAGETGCSYEMSSAAAAYAFHPANAPTNAGFVRDDDTVLLVFVLSDEPDKSPEGVAAYSAMIDDAKSACGGAECVLTAGLINSCVQTNDDPLWQFLNAFGEEPIWGDIEDVERYVEVVGDALARIVRQKCDEVILI